MLKVQYLFGVLQDNKLKLERDSKALETPYHS